MIIVGGAKMNTLYFDRVIYRGYCDVLYYKSRIDFVLEHLDEMNTVDDIIELNDICRYINDYNGREIEVDNYRGSLPQLKQKILKFINNVDDNNFIELIKDIDVDNVEDFWHLLEQYKKTDLITEAEFERYLNQNSIHLYHILSAKKTANKFKDVLYRCIQKDPHTIGLMISYLLEKKRGNQTQMYITETFSSEQLNVLFSTYINSERPHINILRLICISRVDKSLGLDAKIKHLAKNKKEKIVAEFFKSSQTATIHHGIGVTFCNNDSIISYTEDKDCPVLTYDVKWIYENLDCATLLNNFIYLFGFVDGHFRSVFPFNDNDISAFEDVFTVKGKNSYGESTTFELISNLHSLTMRGYVDVLAKHEIDIEKIFKWFFEEYLVNEFSVKGYFYNASSSATYLEKCKNISSEMERVLKQYKLYTEEGYIDNEYYEMSADSCRVEEYRSLQHRKYIYANSDSIRLSMANLFNNQMLCVSYDETLNDFDCFYDALVELKSIDKNKLDRKIQQPYIEQLIESGAVIENNGFLYLNPLKAYLLKLLNDKSVVCYQYVSALQSIIDELIDSGDLVEGNTLFSIPEQKYLNYMLNNAEFSNAPALRNKYSHGSAPINDEINERDYIEFLKIMVLIIIKINEEYCLKYPVDTIIETDLE